jgi:hypothetical protein
MLTFKYRSRYNCIIGNTYEPLIKEDCPEEQQLFTDTIGFLLEVKQRQPGPCSFSV